MTQSVSAIASGTEPRQINRLLCWKDSQAQATSENCRHPSIETLPYPAYDVFGVDDMLESFSLGALALCRDPQPIRLWEGTWLPAIGVVEWIWVG